nr:hypothetical protein [Tanacetum cinerariifolium]
MLRIEILHAVVRTSAYHCGVLRSFPMERIEQGIGRVHSLFSPSMSSESTSLRKSLSCCLGSSDHNSWNEHPFCTNRMVSNRRAYIHKALKEANYETFYDDEEIEFGKPLKEELVNGIKASRASVIVLSENYASSTWCLEELALILDQYRTSNHIVFPIFYHVEPINVRKQQKSFGNAMEKHKRRMEAETNVEEKSRLAEKMGIWKKALAQVANLRGKEPKDRLETKFLEEIVMDIYHRLGVPIRITLPRLIGMSVSIEFVTSWLKDESEHTVDMLTILGMGGIGKTSLAKYVYGLNCREFTRSSFIGRISRRCEENSNGMLDLQKTLCGDISKTSSIQVHDDVSVYTSTIENALARNKVFIILDDIDSLGQLDALLGNKDFHPGSKIIITTKDASLTERCSIFKTKVKPRHTKCLLNVLSKTESLELLCLHAFGFTRNPKKDYEEVSSNIVKYCEGLPLALEVLGKLLHDRDAAYWDDCIKGLNKEPNSPINNVLRKSFDTLPSQNDKDLFKHIACFFVGKDRAFSETILKACDISTHSGISNLIDRCLLSIGRSNELVMHQLVQEMGRDVGTEKVLGLILDMRLLEKETLQGSFELKTDAFSNMDSLMILHLDNVQIKESFENFPKELRWLSMRGFHLKSLPLDLPMKNLVSLDMSYSNIESFDMSRSRPLPSSRAQRRFFFLT